MTYLVERSEVDAAMRTLAQRYRQASPAEAEALLQEVADNGWTTAWWERRGDVDVLHLTPGPMMLDLLLPPAELPPLARKPKRGIGPLATAWRWCRCQVQRHGEC